MHPTDAAAIMARLDDLTARVVALHVTALAIMQRLDRYERARRDEVEAEGDDG